jgi:hypothetical protein
MIARGAAAELNVRTYSARQDTVIWTLAPA